MPKVLGPLLLFLDNTAFLRQGVFIVSINKKLKKRRKRVKKYGEK